MQKFMLIAALTVAALAALFPLRDATLVWEDAKIPSVAMPERKSAEALMDAWSSHPRRLYIPMTETVRQLVKVTAPGGQLTARRLHTLSAALHVANAAMVFLILSLTIQNLPASFLGGLLFALHPLQVEPVAYASALPHVLGASFALLAMWLYLAKVSRFDPMSRQPKRGALYAATGAYSLALLTSPATAVTPILAFMVEKLLPKRESLLSSRRPRWPLAVWAVLAIPAVIAAFRVQQAKAPLEGLAFWTKPMLAGDALSFYLSKIFVPLFVGPDYGRSPTVVLSQWWGYATWVFPTALLLTMLYLRGRNGLWYSAASLIAVVAVAPFLGFVPLEALSASIVADRFVYLAMLGPALALAYAVSMARRSWLPMVAILALVACGWLSRREARHWLTDEALWTHALKINPDSPIAHGILGDQYRAAGDFDKAREHYEKVLQINATDPDIHYFLAGIEERNGNHEKAIQLYEKVLALDPGFAPAYVSVGAAKLAAGDAVGAKSYFRKAVELVPDDRDALRNLGMVFARSGGYAEAIPHLSKALAEPGATTPGEIAETHALLGLSLARTGNLEEGRKHLEEALRLAPEHREAHRTLADLDFEAGRLAEALPHYEKAAQGDDKDRRTLYNLGLIRAGNKDFDGAVDAFERVVKVDPSFAEGHLQLGIVYFRLKRFNEAATQLNGAIELKANLADAHYYIGDIARWQGKESDALAAYYRAIRIDAHHVDANYRLGNHFMQKSQPQQAMRHYQAALRTAPEDPRLKYSLRKAEQSVNGDAAM